MSSLERDSYVKGRRLRDLSQAVLSLALTELEGGATTDKFEAGVLRVTKSIATVFSIRQIPRTELKPKITDFIPSGLGVGYKLRRIGLDEIADRVETGEIAEPSDKIDGLLTNRTYRIAELSDNLTDFIRAESVEDTVDLFFAPSPVYEYYNDRRESNSRSVCSIGQALLGTTALCAYVNGVDFKPIISSLTNNAI